ncbi:adenosylmethionine--8-amino-7-oxononanoate transaminase [Sphingobacterium sp. HJSM2_6]|uniref:adenosylmethionine--8-amino-7-oxononanoate transaminase n=1 Tax=Sphingobacterium sp. HJSM2_6 TaxID=3366264 RepID=UPI003BBC8A22
MQHKLMARDAQVNWHPYSQMKNTVHIPIVRGEGAYLYDANGNSYLDMVCSWWVNLHGHAHPYIAQKVYEQLTRLEHVIFAGFTHVGAIELSERLLALLPKNQKKIFYSDNGSTAVEVALKMCIQYEQSKGRQKKKIMAFRQGYHGDTFGAMAVSERGHWTNCFSDYLFDVIYLDAPTATNFNLNKSIIDQHANETICIIYEPLIQGAGGMLMHEACDLNLLMNYCKNQQILLIQDEIFVGFGRTGTIFAADQLNFEADLYCLSKGLTGGTMALGITSCTQEIYQGFYHDDKKQAFFHGHSFTASPVACAASLASLDLLLEEQTNKSIQHIILMHQAFAGLLKECDKIENIRQYGTLLAFDWLVPEETSYFNSIQSYLYQRFLEHGILLRPLGNTIYLLPPYCISEQDLQRCYQLVLAVLKSD